MSRRRKMSQKRARVGWSGVVAVVALAVMATGAGAEPLDAAATVAALEMRVAALERKRDAQPPVAPVAVPRVAEARRSPSSASEVERYLQYPGQ